jgi:branched-subunit amino acid aminotransferase/4-amino-4-deoxychorismate lyase
VRFGERWVTPPLDAGCLPGIERGVLLESGAVAEAVIPAGRLSAADEIQVVNSVRLRRRAVLC